MKSTRKWKIFSCAALVAFAVFLTACPPRVRAGDLLANPGRYAGKQVSVTGTVTESFSLMGYGAFKIDDGTGSIWVLSETYGAPSKGARAVITGTVAQGVSIGTRSFATAVRQTKPPHY